MTSFFLPVINRFPRLSRRPRSPEWNQPSFSTRCRSFEILVVAFHHDRPADSNFADAGAVRIDNLELYAWQSGSHGADNVVFHACDRGGSRRLSEAVALENGESQIMKILGHIQVKGRSATDEEPELAAERAMDLAEEQLAKIKTEQAGASID